MHAIAKALLPRRNDYSALSWDELLSEVARFGITTRGEFTRLLKRHRRALIAIDRKPPSPGDVAFFKQQYGDTYVRDRLRRQYWFAFQGLVRVAMELEFGEAAEVWETSPDTPETER